jgi:hypothetical protein
MPGKPLPPYHIGDQHAVALLPPIGDSLGELEERLTQYADRLRLSDADRKRVRVALEIVAEARRQLSDVIATVPG